MSAAGKYQALHRVLRRSYQLAALQPGLSAAYGQQAQYCCNSDKPKGAACALRSAVHA